MYADHLAQSIDSEHLAFQSLPTPIPHWVRELRKVKREIMTGAQYIGTELEQIDTCMIQVEVATKGLQEALKRVSGMMDGPDNSQTQHEEVTSHLHQTIQADGGAAGAVTNSWDRNCLIQVSNINANYKTTRGYSTL